MVTFDTLATTLKSIGQTFSIIALAETNIDPEVKETFIIPNYASAYQRKKAGKAKGSGLGICIHKSINYQIMEELSTCCDDIESLFIEVKRPSESKPTIIGAIYRPPSGSPNNFHEKLSELLSSLRPDDNIILMGDFNLILFSHNCHTNTFEESMFCNGFTPVISTATHKKPDCHFTCIDNIFFNHSEHVVYSCTLESHISHHRSLILKYSLKNSLCSTNASRKEKTEVYYDYKPQNLDKLNENLADKLLDNSVSKEDTDFEEFMNTFQKCIDATCKLKIPKISNRNKQQNPWITTGLINSISKRDRLYKIWKRTQTKRCTTGDPRLHKQYRRYRNMLGNLIQKSKQNFYAKAFEKASGDMRRTWSIINDLRGKNQMTSSYCIKDGNSVINDDKAIANKFNEHFCSLAENLNKSIQKSEIRNFRDYLPHSQTSSIFLEKTTPAEIMSIIKEFKNDKSSDIPIVVIKHCSPIISPTLCSLFNRYMESGEFPQILKVGRISPIYEKDAKDNIKNYRPISTLPIFGKIFEKILYSRIYDFVTSKNIFSETQFGFRKLHSTSHAIHHSVNFIKK